MPPSHGGNAGSNPAGAKLFALISQGFLRLQKGDGCHSVAVARKRADIIGCLEPCRAARPKR
jgi:hypothetical protein